VGNSNRSCPFLTQTEIQIGIDRGNEMFEKLGISFGTALIVLLACNEEEK